MIDALEIGYAIKDRRAELGLTQAQLAETAGVSKRCLWSLELGQNPGVQLNKLTAVLDALGLDLSISAMNVTDTDAHPKVRATTVNANLAPRVTTDDADTVPHTATDTISDASTGKENVGIDAIAILTGGQQ